VIIKFELPYLPPTPNRRRSFHWTKRHRVDSEIKRDVTLLVRAAGWRNGNGPIPNPRITITHYYGTRRWRDDDNARAATKETVDALVQEGVIPGDSVAEIGVVEHLFEYRKGRPGLLVQVTSQP
jgi:hypothetical protein